MSGPKPFHITPGKTSGFSCKQHSKTLRNGILGRLIWYINSGASKIVCVLSHFSRVQFYGVQPTRLLCPWVFPAKNIGGVAISSSREGGGIQFLGIESYVLCILSYSYVSCIGRWVLYPQCHLVSPQTRLMTNNLLSAFVPDIVVKVWRSQNS